MSHESEQYLTNPRPRLLHQSWGSNTLTRPLRQFSCPQASRPVTGALVSLFAKVTGNSTAFNLHLNLQFGVGAPVRSVLCDHSISRRRLTADTSENLAKCTLNTVEYLIGTIDGVGSPQ